MKTTYKEKHDIFHRYQELQPVLSEYGDKINAYKNLSKVTSKFTIGFFKIAYELLKRKTAGIVIAIIGYIFLFVSKNIFLSGLLLGGFIIVFFALRFYSKIHFAKFKKDLIQALFLDHDIVVSHQGSVNYPKSIVGELSHYDKPNFLNSEDYIQGNYKEFLFSFSEIRAKGSLRWTGLSEIYSGLFFQGVWSSDVPFLNDFSIKKVSLLDSLNRKKEHKFLKYFILKDNLGLPVEGGKVDELIPAKIQKDLIKMALKYNDQFEVIFENHKIYFLIKGTRDYFPLDFWQEVDGPEVFEKIIKDSLFFVDFIKAINQ